MKIEYLDLKIRTIRNRIKLNIPSLDIFNEEIFEVFFSGNLTAAWSYINKDYRSNFLYLIKKNISEGRFASSYNINIKIKRISTLSEVNILISSLCNKDKGFTFSVDYYFEEFLPVEILEIFRLLKGLFVGNEEELMYLRKCLCMFLFTKTKEEIAQIKDEILKYQSKPINNKFVLF